LQGNIFHHVLENAGGVWSVNGTAAGTCASLPELVKYLMADQPTIDWDTPLTHYVSHPDLVGSCFRLV
jgi:hypothetical protein